MNEISLPQLHVVRSFCHSGAVALHSVGLRGNMIFVSSLCDKGSVVHRDRSRFGSLVDTSPDRSGALGSAICTQSTTVGNFIALRLTGR